MMLDIPKIFDVFYFQGSLSRKSKNFGAVLVTAWQLY